MDELWAQFQASGSVADYLAYAAIKEIEHADSERRRAQSENDRRAGQIH